MLTKIVSVSVLCLGLICAGYLIANEMQARTNPSDPAVASDSEGATPAAASQAAVEDCCKQKLACCDKGAAKACCVAKAQLACCAKGMKCCADSSACCSGVQDCCRQGLACCNEGKACCGKQ